MSIQVSDLSPDQLEVFNAVIGWAGRDFGSSSDQVLSVGGYAGTGKTTVVSLVAENLPPPIAFCAFTGKASSVLKRKLAAAGMFTVGTQPATRDGRRSSDERPYCGTIHALIYRPCECREPKQVEVQKPCPSKGCPGETSWDPIEEESVCALGHHGLVKNEAAVVALKKRVVLVPAPKDDDGRCKVCGGKEWLRREILDRDYSLIIVDEASMVDDTMLRDLRSFEVPILAVGDHGQLPPVGGSGSLMKAPHLRLEKIHRQAEGNPIIALSKMIRETGRLPDALPGDAVKFAKLRFLEQELEARYTGASPAKLLSMGLACYTNRRRVGLNVAVRRILGTARVGKELPRVGEHVVCLKNMKTRNGGAPIYNGMRGVMTSNAEPKKNVNVSGVQIGESEIHLTGTIEFPDDDIESREYEMLRAQFGREKTYSAPEELQREVGIHSFAMAGALFDYGYAMTVHKMQGSQYEDLAVLVERPGPVPEEDWRRWLYTAVTRASDRLTVLR